MATERVRIFCDFWNFQLSWNGRSGSQCDWTQVPKVLLNEAASKLGGVAASDLEFSEICVYASINPASEKDRKLEKWLESFLNRQPGFRVFISKRSTKQRPVKCSHCFHEVADCPNCNFPYSRSPEKGIDSAIITDLLTLAWEGAFDIAILVTSDADFIPAVKRLQDKGLKVINATWKDNGFDLAKTCWASFELDSLILSLQRTP